MWNHLRMAARTRYMRQNACKPATLNRRYQLGGLSSSWRLVQRTWGCLGATPYEYRVLSCIPRYEGGYPRPDVWFTEQSARSAMGHNYMGWLNGKFEGTDRVVGHLQVRPYHARRAHPELARTDADRRVTRQTFNIITSPYTHAQINLSIFRDRPGAYATLSLCS